MIWRCCRRADCREEERHGHLLNRLTRQSVSQSSKYFAAHESPALLAVFCPYRLFLQSKALAPFPKVYTVFSTARVGGSTRYVILSITLDTPPDRSYTLSNILYKKTRIGDIVNQLKPPEIGYQARIRTNVIRLFRWNGAWGAAT